MNKIEVIIKPGFLREFQNILIDLDITDYYVIELQHHLQNENVIRHYRGAEYSSEYIAKAKIEMYLEDENMRILKDRIINIKDISIISYVIENYRG